MNYLDIDQKNYKDICNILRKHNLLNITIAELDIDQYLDSTINSKNNVKNRFLGNTRCIYGNGV